MFADAATGKTVSADKISSQLKAAQQQLGG
jgi:hypothetical protein